MSPEVLNETLRKFYAEVKSVNPNKTLSPSALLSIRAAIQRFLTEAPNSRAINIISDTVFIPANKILQARCKLYYKAGNAKPKHKPAISSDDMEKIGNYFQDYDKNPEIL